jgi:hypothetical protein
MISDEWIIFTVAVAILIIIGCIWKCFPKEKEATPQG